MPKSVPSRNFVLTKCGAFTDFQLWPGSDDLDSEGWLKNFDASEMPYALTLLNHFVYCPRKFVTTLVRAAIHDLSREFTRNATTLATGKHAWKQAFDEIVVTRVTGENPNPTDSSYQFVRLARQHAGIPEGRIVEPDVLAPALLRSKGKIVVFLDDFVGSGNQFNDTWARLYASPQGKISFEKIHALGLGHRFTYLPLVATSYGIGRIRDRFPTVDLRPTHVLGDEYNCLHAKCSIWTPELKPHVVSVLKNASDRAGIPTADWDGFHHLGLALAFEGSTPDATLPLFYWNQNGWRRLVMRA